MVSLRSLHSAIFSSAPDNCRYIAEGWRFQAEIIEEAKVPKFPPGMGRDVEGIKIQNWRRQNSIIERKSLKSNIISQLHNFLPSLWSNTGISHSAEKEKKNFVRFTICPRSQIHSLIFFSYTLTDVSSKSNIDGIIISSHNPVEHNTVFLLSQSTRTVK